MKRNTTFVVVQTNRNYKVLFVKSMNKLLYRVQSCNENMINLMKLFYFMQIFNFTPVETGYFFPLSMTNDKKTAT